MDANRPSPINIAEWDLQVVPETTLTRSRVESSQWGPTTTPTALPRLVDRTRFVWSTRRKNGWCHRIRWSRGSCERSCGREPDPQRARGTRSRRARRSRELPCAVAGTLRGFMYRDRSERRGPSCERAAISRDHERRVFRTIASRNQRDRRPLGNRRKGLTMSSEASKAVFAVFPATPKTRSCESNERLGPGQMVRRAVTLPAIHNTSGLGTADPTRTGCPS